MHKHRDSFPVSVCHWKQTGDIDVEHNRHNVEVGNHYGYMERDVRGRTIFLAKVTAVNDYFATIQCGVNKFKKVPINFLLLLPVPIPLDKSEYENDNDSDCESSEDSKSNHRNCNTSNRNEWVVTEAIYAKGIKYYMQSLKFAKTGNWDQFETKFINSDRIKIRVNKSHLDFCCFNKNLVIAEAIAYGKLEFVNKYIEHFPKVFNDLSNIQLCLETCVIYNQLPIFKTVISLLINYNKSKHGSYRQFLDQKKSQDNCLKNIIHLAIMHENEQFIKYFISTECMRQYYSRFVCAWRYRIQDSNINVLGTAIVYNNINIIKMIVDWNQTSIAKMDDLYVDSFVFAGNTAIQLAFMVCNDNFELLKYLLDKHQPYWLNYSIQHLDLEDPYLETVQSSISNNSKMIKKGLKGFITNKPDTEGYTIDERIKQCRDNSILTQNQCDQLQTILQSKRKTIPLKASMLDFRWR